jgi:hypothetical protein
MAKEVRMPAIDEIAGLTRWAQVLFAARCAERLEPFVRTDPRATPKIVLAVTDAISAAYEAVASAGLGRSWNDANRARLAAIVAGRRLSEVPAAHNMTMENGPGRRAAFAAAHAADAAAAAIADREAIGVSSGPDHVAYAAAVLGSWIILDMADPGDVRWAVFHRTARQDFWVLSKRAERMQWTNDTPIAAAVCGPPWPKGPPEGWPA